MKVLVTGASGFVGSAVLRSLVAQGHDAVGAVRCVPANPVPGARYTRGADLLEPSSWPAAMEGIDAVIHAAARVHVMADKAKDPLAEFRRANTEGSLAVAGAAADAGVRRFVFVSSIKVNGESTTPGAPFRADQEPSPSDPYGVSKLEAEQALFALGDATQMGITIVRPPLVYGPGVRANFAAMMKALSMRVPLPLGRATARRSMIFVENLASLLISAAECDRAQGQVLLGSDGEDLSVRDLLWRLGIALGKPAILLPVPVTMLNALGRMTGKEAVMQRLLSPLQVDIEPTQRLLGWTPPIRVDAGLRATAAAYLRAQ